MGQSITTPAKGNLLRCELASASLGSRQPQFHESGLFETSIINSSAALSSLITTPAAEIGHINGIFGAANAIGSLEREAIPWNKIADWTHGLRKTSTDHWLDVVDGAVRGPHHRWLRHNPIDFLEAWLKDSSGKLKLADYVRHLTLDAVTTNGLPMLSEAVHEFLLKAGIPFSDLVAFTHLNVFDLTVGTLAIADGSHSLFLALTGHLPWHGTQTFLFTFGTGSLNIAGGLGLVALGGTHGNALLLAAGAMQISSGALSLCQHWMLPEPSLFELALPYLLRGAEIGTLASAVRLAICWRKSNATQRLGAGAETMILSLSSSLLGAVSSWLAVPVSVGYGFSKLAWKIADRDSRLFDQGRVSSPVSFTLAMDSLFKNGGPEAVESFREYLTKSHQLDTVLAPRFFEEFDLWDKPPPGTEHVAASQPFSPIGWASEATEQSMYSLPDTPLEEKEFKQKEWENERQTEKGSTDNR